MRKNIAIVTGANRGLGLAAADALAEKNYYVIYCGRNMAALNAAVLKSTEKGYSAEAFELDLNNSEAIRKLKDHVDSLAGTLKIIVNNAGIFSTKNHSADSKGGDTFETNIGDIKAVFETNTLVHELYH